MTAAEWPTFDSWPDYELLDFGGGRRLERFGPHVISRPSPAASAPQVARPDLWQSATAEFIVRESPTPKERTDNGGGQRGAWCPDRALPERWTIDCGPLRLELKPTDFGHLGVFPEQLVNWRWLAEQLHAGADGALEPRRVLNLFAYTGASTLAAAAAGAHVTHVDSSRSAVAWARRNAELSGLAEAPVRWIVEDAARFVRRELNRSRRYDGVVLDPPSYGHGPAGQAWKIEEHLSELLTLCGKLLNDRPFVLLSCHTPSVTADVAATLIAEALGTSRSDVRTEPLTIPARDGRRLPAGISARFATK